MNENVLIIAVQTVLSPDLILKKFRDHPENPMYGQCYGASEALYHLLGGNDCGYKPRRGLDDDGVAHWWILSPIGNILDPTAAQYTDLGKTPPYARGRGSSFGKLSKRARIIMQRVSCLHIV